MRSATQKFLFVNNNNYRQLELPVIGNTTGAATTVASNVVRRGLVDRFRQIIGNYWYARGVDGKPDDTGFPYQSGNPVDDKSSMTWGEKRRYPFEIRLASTHSYTTYTNLPTTLKVTPITLIADSRFGPYPDCLTCWYRYLYGVDQLDPTTPIDKVFGFDPLRLQDVESVVQVNIPGVATPYYLKAAASLTMLVITEAGLPTTDRLAELGVDISYLSAGRNLVNAIRQAVMPLTTGSLAGGLSLSFDAKLFRDSYFENGIAADEKLEESIESNLDFELNASVQFRHNYTAKEYEKINNENISVFGYEAERLVNMYEYLYNSKSVVSAEIVKLRSQIDCFAENLKLFFRNPNVQKGGLTTRVIYVLAETVPLINKTYPFQDLMPYYSRIKFDLEETGPMGAALEETRNDGIVMRHMQENRGVYEANNYRTFKQTFAKAKKGSNYISKLIPETRDVTLKSWGFYEWMLKLGDRLSYGVPPVDQMPSDSIIINDSTKSALATRGVSTLAANYELAVKALHAKATDLVKFYSRDYVDLLKGKMPYREVVAYKIQKYGNLSVTSDVTSTATILGTTLYESLYGDNGVISTQQAQPIQEIWFFNTAKEDIINYVDTQIMSDKYYTYVVNSYVLSLDSDYYYTNATALKFPCNDVFTEFPFAAKGQPPTWLSQLSTAYLSLLRQNGGLTYSLAYDASLVDLASRSSLPFESSKHELKLMLMLNPNGCSQVGATAIYPTEILRMIALYGVDGTQTRLTNLFVSCLDGTLIAGGFRETVVAAILAKVTKYITDGCVTAKLLASCDRKTDDPCLATLTIGARQNAKYSLPEEYEAAISAKISAILSNETGDTIDISNLTPEQIEPVASIFIEILNTLYNTGALTVDPNTGENAAIVRDFFEQIETSGQIEVSDVIVLLSLLNADLGQMKSVMGSISAEINQFLQAFFDVSITVGADITADYNSNTLIYQSMMRFEKTDITCTPGQAVIQDKNIKITCECREETERCRISFLANVVTNPTIYEVPYYFASGRAVAELPTPPDVQFIPYKDVDNLVLINLNTMAGKYTTQFVPVVAADEEYINTLASSRGVGSDALFDFEGDPDVLFYEAFRIEEKPTSYTDFANGTYFKFDLPRNPARSITNRSAFRETTYETYSNAISREHTIAPNKKYYYIFRTIDINGNLSNPSKVFEIEMVNNGGAIFPIIRVVDFEIPKPYSYDFEMRRFLLLSVAPTQTEILQSVKEVSSQLGFVSARDVVRNFKLFNNSENSVWNKSFKIRLTALDTGRMLDINISPSTTIDDPSKFCGSGQSDSVLSVTAEDKDYGVSPISWP
jgi:hypothetical protein